MAERRTCGRGVRAGLGRRSGGCGARPLVPATAHGPNRLDLTNGRDRLVLGTIADDAARRQPVRLPGTITVFEEQAAEAGWSIIDRTDMQAVAADYGARVPGITVLDLCPSQSSIEIAQRHGERIVTPMVPCTGSPGRYGPYTKCRSLTTNTAVPVSCPSCGEEGRLAVKPHRFNGAGEPCDGRFEVGFGVGSGA